MRREAAQWRNPQTNITYNNYSVRNIIYVVSNEVLNVEVYFTNVCVKNMNKCTCRYNGSRGGYMYKRQLRVQYIGV